MALQLLAKRRALRSPSLVRQFSSSAASGDDNNRSRPSLNSYLKEVKSSLTQQTEKQSPSFQRLRRFAPSESPPQKVQPTTIDAIRKNLSLYRDRSSSSSSAAASQSESEKSSPYADIRKNMTMLQRRTSFGSPALNLGSPPPPGTRTAMRSAEDLPQSVFGKELKARSTAMSERSLRTFGFQELGEKLKKLRPVKKENEGDWFSLEELSGRLNRLLEAEEEEARNAPPPQISGAGGSQVGTFQYMKNVMDQLANPEPEKQINSGVIEALTMTNTPTYLELAPKDHLLETYNHPDNMSAAEKMKIELAKVRDEFKMSESDCGSTRVQVALLTTKIKYLSSTLHKKDKHSRKGLVEMVDKRKRLLKYLRRTDWPSYCFVLDKLGLRDFNKFKR